MKVFLVDCENVGVKDFIPNIIDGCNKFVLFVNNKVKISITASYMQWLMENRDYIEFVETESTGKNAIDFIMVHYLCMAFVADPNARYVFVSNDKGFDALLSKMQNQGCDISRVSGIDKNEVKSNDEDVSVRDEGAYNRYYTNFMNVISSSKAKPKTLKGLMNVIQSAKPPSNSRKADVDIAFYVVEKMKAGGFIVVDGKGSINWSGFVNYGK